MCQKGKQIFNRKCDIYINGPKGRNTKDWREKGKKGHFRKIISHFNESTIPYENFEKSERLCQELFGNKRVWNYIYYPIFKAIEIGILRIEDDCLRYRGWIDE